MTAQGHDQSTHEAGSAPSGAHSFTCQRGRLRGRIVVEAA